jgi:hypothetical protein
MTFINYPTPSLNASQSQACHCMGKRPGQPLCPCGMRGLVQRDGRWIRPEQDMGPVMPEALGTICGGDVPRLTRRRLCVTL